MKKKQNNLDFDKRALRLQLLSYIVIFYMFSAFTWWAILLNIKNKEIFDARISALKLEMKLEKTYVNEDKFMQDSKYLSIKRKHDTQQKMILGEGLVFTLSLLIGIWLIVNSTKKELDAAKARKNFLLSISHELKSPLASIKLTFDTLLKRNLEKEMIDKLSQNATKEAVRMERLINDLLLATRLETLYIPTFEPFDVVELTKTTFQGYKNQYPNSEIEFDSSLQKLIISLDKVGYISILNNLIENAIKYSKDKININITLKKSKDHLVLEVKDKGIGISDTDKKLIFNRFYRSGNEETRNTKGTGLGLYIANQMAKLHDAELSVMDNIPSGSIFKLTLPIK